MPIYRVTSYQPRKRESYWVIANNVVNARTVLGREMGMHHRIQFFGNGSVIATRRID